MSQHVLDFKEKLRNLTFFIKKIVNLKGDMHCFARMLMNFNEFFTIFDNLDFWLKYVGTAIKASKESVSLLYYNLFQGFEGKITAQGKLLHKGPLNALDNFSPAGQANAPPKIKPFTCFLFEQIMIFSETMGKKTQFTSPVYVYKYHFLVSFHATRREAPRNHNFHFFCRSNFP